MSEGNYWAPSSKQLIIATDYNILKNFPALENNIGGIQAITALDVISGQRINVNLQLLLLCRILL